MEKCAVCGKQGEASAIPRCSRCKTIRYCSRACQSRDWPRHKTACKPTGADAGASGDGASRPAQHETRRAPAAYSPQAWNNLFSSLYPHVTSVTDLWQQARSRAEAAFPGNRITDSCHPDDLDLDENMEVTEIRPVNPVVPMPSPPVKSPPPFEPFSFLLFPLFMPSSLSKPFFALSTALSLYAFLALFAVISSMPFLPCALPPVKRRVKLVSRNVLVLRLVRRVPRPGVVFWLAEDRHGGQIVVAFDTLTSAFSHFRFDDLQQGHFLCLKHAQVIVLTPEESCFILVQDAASVRVFNL